MCPGLLFGMGECIFLGFHDGHAAYEHPYFTSRRRSLAESGAPAAEPAENWLERLSWASWVLGLVPVHGV